MSRNEAANLLLIRDRWLLWGVALVLRLVTAAFIQQPGYMDTAYYTVQGLRLAEGNGPTEPYLWNYLDDPAGLPHPAFGYWMPLPSLLTAPFWAAGRSFLAAQLPFALLAALLVVLAAQIAWEVTGRRQAFWAAGALLGFSVYFFPYWTLPETFAPFALAGAVALWAGGRYWEGGEARWAALAAGGATLAYLTRSDGLLLVGLTLGLPLIKRQGRALLAAGLTTALLLSPWVAYNLHTWHTWLPTGGTQALWLTTYDDLFCYHCQLTPAAYLAAGWQSILNTKLEALSWNLKTLWAVIGYIFVAPLALVGGWQLRRRPALGLAWLYLLLLFAAMTFAFTFPGPRGGFFHSGGAVLPFMVVAGLVGLERVVAWVGRRRHWHIPQAQAVFTWGLVFLAAGMSLALALPKVRTWNAAVIPYQQAGIWLAERDPAGCPVLVADPPRFWYTTRRTALVVPNEGPAVVAEVARRYGACWLLLDIDHPQPLASLYAAETQAGWRLVNSWNDLRLYRLEGQ